MSEARAVALSLLAILGSFAVVAPASLALPGPASPADGVAAPSFAAPAANNTSMGGQVSSFMHASSGRASVTVESGMWNAAFASASNKSTVVDSRARDISNRIAELRDQKQQTITAWQNDEISRAEYRARMSAVVGRMAALNQSIDETEQQARTSGANVTRVRLLRKQAAAAAGPEVTAVANSFAGGPPEGVPGVGNPDGPPGQGGPTDPSVGPPNGTPGNHGNGNGPQGNESSSGNGGGPKGGGPNDDNGNDANNGKR